ncbi:MAG: hypothetical protein FJZ98_04870 [Chloroflexi bacterium]|nr:hypothetical protein [Chloroflexota bacterium]
MGEENKLFELIERKLDQALLPVNPEENYISSLNTRLFSHPRISIERDKTLKIILLVFLAFTTGSLVIFLMHVLFSRRTRKKAE